MNRQCFCCREPFEKQTMLRLVLDDKGHLWPDLLQKAPGRGSYLCMQVTCLSRLNDKRLRASAAKKGQLICAKRDLLFAQIQELMAQLSTSYLQMHRAAVGREACLTLVKTMKNVQFLLASDAGKVIERDVETWVQQGKRTLLHHWFSVAELGDVFGRDKVSLVALQNKVVFQRIVCFSEWNKRLGEVG
ncbi:MAG: DUF448 domain-containing protein [Mariprofundaceae bacterium]|nr:DUF448 domain-containing protein [Mariprofundaceae bacterium]